MARHFINVTPAATAATIDHAILQIWNPTGQPSARVRKISNVFRAAAPAAGAGWYMRRSTARGTAGSTITPTAAMHRINEVAAGFLIDLAAFTVQPTLAAGDLGYGWGFGAVQGSGVILPIDEIEVPPNTGLVLCNIAAVVFAVAEWLLEIEN